MSQQSLVPLHGKTIANCESLLQSKAPQSHHAPTSNKFPPGVLFPPFAITTRKVSTEMTSGTCIASNLHKKEMFALSTKLKNSLICDKDK